MFMERKGGLTTLRQYQWMGGHFEAYRLALGGNSCGVNPHGFD